MLLQYIHTKPLFLSTCLIKKFEVKADDLIQLKERGRGAYGVVYEMQHRESGTIMAVKVPMATQYTLIFHMYVLACSSMKLFIYCIKIHGTIWKGKHDITTT